MERFVISPQEMYAAERAVFDTGVPSFDLMRVAGQGVAEKTHHYYPEGRVAVLCGPGGNGGDGFVAARHLVDWGRDVSVYLLGSAEGLKGDTRMAASMWGGEILGLSVAIDTDAEIIIDALFGAGLSRPLEGTSAELTESIRGIVVSVDVPSGLDGLTGQLQGACFKADRTVTFAALRPGHVLSPGRHMCGRIEVLDIGVAVPEHSSFRSITKDESKRALLLKNEKDLTQSDTALLQPFPNRIEALRSAAIRQGRDLLLERPDRILATAEGKVTIDP